jgi:hypothetical protein
MQNLTKQLQISLEANMFPNISYIGHSILFYFEVKGIYQKNLEQFFFHLHHVNISISMALLQNTTKFGFVPICTKKKKVKEFRCKIIGKGWIMGIY